MIAVTYWEGGRRTVTRTGPWETMPTAGVLWVTLVRGRHRHVLLGADGYWVLGDRYGMTYEDAQPRYGGRPYAAWEWREEGARFLGEQAPPAWAHTVRGVQVPDDVWAALRDRRR